MNFKAAIISFTLAITSSNLLAQIKDAGRWYAESQDRIYYYISIDRTSDNLSKFYKLLLEEGWKTDVQGLSDPYKVSMRLYRPKENGPGTRFFPNDKNWFNQATSGSIVSYKIFDSMSERDKLIKDHQNKGHELTLWAANDEIFTWTITFKK